MAKRGVTRNKILEAADKRFGASGFDAVSTRDVAKEAGVNQALVFYHFGNKEGLFRVVLERYGTRLDEALNEALTAKGASRERIHHVLDTAIDFVDANPRFAKLVQRQLVSGGQVEAVRAALVPLKSWTGTVLGELSPPNVAHLAPEQFFVSFVSALFGYPAAGPVFLGHRALSDDGRAARRGHMHWMVDCVIPRLRSERLIVRVSLPHEQGESARSDEYLR